MTTPALDCLAVMRQLWDYLDGEVEKPTWEGITTHLSACSGCAGHVEFARSFLHHVGTATVSEPELLVLRERVVVALRAG